MTENSSKQPSPDGIVFEPLPKDKQFHDITGRVYNFLTVLGYAGKTEGSNPRHSWYMKCVCGVVKRIPAGNFKSGNCKSCGCMHYILIGNGKRTHGMTSTAEFRAWTSMKSRCLSPSNKFFAHYGGRGIKVCNRWLESFENFYEDMGPRPSSDHSIDRINNHGNYEPGNCRWTTRTVQQRNTRRSKPLVANGKSQCLADWASESGIHRCAIAARIRAGWSIEDAVNTPVRSTIQPSQTPCTDQPASPPHQTYHA